MKIAVKIVYSSTASASRIPDCEARHFFQLLRLSVLLLVGCAVAAGQSSANNAAKSQQLAASAAEVNKRHAKGKCSKHPRQCI